MCKDFNTKTPWWKKTVVYQIYPRSFYDSDGDGIGDLDGIISKIDYLKDLGVETIWFSPFFKSPQKDFGYDISDFTEIDPQYGDINTCDKLIKEIHKRGMKIVLDLVLNHTSDKHPWFIESRSSKDNPKREWYIWKNGRGNKPPNNWLSMVGGSGWHHDKLTNQWYWAQFLPFQPDLNYRNPEVKKTMLDIVRFWLNKEVDGFRLDIIDTIYEDSQFRNNPFSFKFIPSDTSIKRFFQNSIYTLDHPDTLEFVKELRETINEYNNPERFLVGEIITDFSTAKKYCGDNQDGLHSVFLFKTLRTPHNANKFRSLIKEFETHFSEPNIPTWTFTNHDRLRRITRLGNDIAKAKLHAAFHLTVRGVPYIYYGEEIGMESPRMIQKESTDEMALKYKWIPQFAFDFIRKVGIESFNRDEQRTPMQWNDDLNSGFCPKSAEPWLSIPNSYKERNVECQKKDPNSLFNCYKRFLKVRNETSALNSGSIKIIKDQNIPKDVLSYVRISNNNAIKQKAYVFLNFSNKEKTFSNPTDNSKILVSTHKNYNLIEKNKIKLRPQEGIVILN